MSASLCNINLFARFNNFKPSWCLKGIQPAQLGVLTIFTDALIRQTQSFIFYLTLLLHGISQECKHLTSSKPVQVIIIARVSPISRLVDHNFCFLFSPHLYTNCSSSTRTFIHFGVVLYLQEKWRKKRDQKKIVQSTYVRTYAFSTQKHIKRQCYCFCIGYMYLLRHGHSYTTEATKQEIFNLCYVRMLLRKCIKVHFCMYFCFVFCFCIAFYLFFFFFSSFFFAVRLNLLFFRVFIQIFFQMVA